jgi:hypothetical protein
MTGYSIETAIENGRPKVREKEHTVEAPDEAVTG